MLHYALTSNHSVRRGLGSYANALYSIIRHSGILMSEEMWQAKIGADKFYEAVEMGLLEAENIDDKEDIERKGQLIKETPPKPIENKPYKISRIISYSANNAGPVWEQAVVVELQINNQDGIVRFYQHGKDQIILKEEWTTNNLELATDLCKNLEQIRVDALNQVGDKTLFGDDTGPLAYDVMSKCSASDQ